MHAERSLDGESAPTTRTSCAPCPDQEWRPRNPETGLQPAALHAPLPASFKSLTPPFLVITTLTNLLQVATQQQSLVSAQEALELVTDLLNTARQELATAATEHRLSLARGREEYEESHLRLSQEAEQSRVQSCAALHAAAAVHAAALAAAAAEGQEAQAVAVREAVAGAAAAVAVAAGAHAAQLEHEAGLAEGLRERLTGAQLELAQVGRLECRGGKGRQSLTPGWIKAKWCHWV